MLPECCKAAWEGCLPFVHGGIGGGNGGARATTKRTGKKLELVLLELDCNVLAARTSLLSHLEEKLRTRTEDLAQSAEIERLDAQDTEVLQEVLLSTPPLFDCIGAPTFRERCWATYRRAAL